MKDTISNGPVTIPKDSFANSIEKLIQIRKTGKINYVTCYP